MKTMTQDFINDCFSYSDVSKKLYGYQNSSTIRRSRKIIEDLCLDTSHFDNGKSKRTKYKKIIKTCPICSKLFETLENHSREKQTCSYGCANTLFRSGQDNGNWIQNGKTPKSSYIRACFSIHKRECAICGESLIVAVHHLDLNKKNNDPKNLVPLCPTHHMYWHSKYKNLIYQKVIDYMKSVFKD